MRREKLLALCLTLTAAIGMSGCNLMPKEEQLPQAPVIEIYEGIEYTQTTVYRGDLVRSTNVNCTYVPVKEEKYSFRLGGETIQNIYVTKGQQVKAGELLAELAQDNLKEQILSQEYNVQVLEMKLRHAKEQEDLEQGEQYTFQIQSLHDSLYIAQLRLDEMNVQLKERQIYATMDGTVTFVEELDEYGNRSQKGKTIVTIADLDTTVFKISGKDTQYFNDGDQVVVTKDKTQYLTQVTSLEELGIDIPKEENTVYLKLEVPDPTLTDGDKGTIRVILEEAYDVLCLKKRAVKSTETSQFVYVLNEDGIKVMKEITTGISAGGIIEVTGGLKEGDLVIVE